MRYYIHYPSGGFGHYMLQMISICFEDAYCPQENSTFSENGNSHNYPLHCKTWFHNEPYIEENYYNFEDKKSICLIDSGIDDYLDRGMTNTIRMCIDNNAKSIVYQTCREKAEQLKFSFDLQDYEIREHFSLTYHHSDNNKEFYLNRWQPLDTTINLNISDLFFNSKKVIKRLIPHFGHCNLDKFESLHTKFKEANLKYYRAQDLVNCVKNALENNIDFELNKNYTLHDQGYLIYWLEKQYNIKEIPPYDYKDWFKNTQDIKNCLKSILSQ